jgi:hypothetical protein
MKIPHPYSFVPAESRKTLFYLFLILSILCLLVFQFLLEPPLRTTAAPWGIVSFELAFSVETVRAIMGSWNATARDFATFGLGFDYLFMLCYSFGLGLGTLMASSRLETRFQSLGVWLGWGVCLAALLDALENLFLFAIMTSGNMPPYPLLAGLSAFFKFIFILAGLFYGLLGWLMPARQPGDAKVQS